MTHIAELTEQFLAAANPEKARHLMRFFKTGEGQYGHGDQFLGLPVPATRALIKPCLVVEKGHIRFQPGLGIA